jgi:hypothetical protein
MAGQMDGDEKFAAKILGEKEESFDFAGGFAEGKNATVSHAMLRRSAEARTARPATGRAVAESVA